MVHRRAHRSKDSRTLSHALPGIDAPPTPNYKYRFTYVELRVALGSILDRVLAGLPVLGVGSGLVALEAAGNRGRAQARGGPESGAADDARHGVCN